jgi:hypothetical protein
MIAANERSSFAGIVRAHMGIFIPGGFADFAALASTGGVVWDNHPERKTQAS